MKRPEPSPTTSPTPAVRDLTGKTLGDFQVERLLGHGGMGEVYLARQVSLDRLVALKVLRPDLLSNPTYLSRFESEAWTAAKLNHPNIVHIYTLGEVDGIRFIAMEYVAGTNLREYLIKKGSPDLPMALSFMKQAGQAVAAAGEMRLVHRDIKPENLLLTRKGELKVADFGLARGFEADRLHLTQPNVTLGTPLYMSPEQAKGSDKLDHRSDLYSLGVTYYHMLAGVPPFRAENGLALAMKHVHEQPVSLAVHRPDLPPDLVALVMKLMAKDPKDRYQTAEEMLRDLARIRKAIVAQAATQVATEAVPAAPEAEATEPARKPFSIRAPKVRFGRLSIGLSLLGLLAGGPARLGRPGGRPAGPRAAAARPASPGLWMEPWREVAPRRTAEEQYHYALLSVPSPDRPAAWLAVPGHFPEGSRVGDPVLYSTRPRDAPAPRPRAPGRPRRRASALQVERREGAGPRRLGRLGGARGRPRGGLGGVRRPEGDPHQRADRPGPHRIDGGSGPGRELADGRRRRRLGEPGRLLAGLLKALQVDPAASPDRPAA